MDKEILNGMFSHMLRTESETMTSVVQPTKHSIGFDKEPSEKAKYTIKIEKKKIIINNK